MTDMWTTDRLLLKLAELLLNAEPRHHDMPAIVPLKIQQHLNLKPLLDQLLKDQLIEALATPEPVSNPSVETYRITPRGWRRIYDLDIFLSEEFGFPFEDLQI